MNCRRSPSEASGCFSTPASRTLTAGVSSIFDEAVEGLDVLVRGHAVGGVSGQGGLDLGLGGQDLVLGLLDRLGLVRARLVAFLAELGRDGPESFAVAGERLVLLEDGGGAALGELVDADCDRRRGVLERDVADRLAADFHLARGVDRLGGELGVAQLVQWRRSGHPRGRCQPRSGCLSAGPGRPRRPSRTGPVPASLS